MRDDQPDVVDGHAGPPHHVETRLAHALHGLAKDFLAVEIPAGLPAPHILRGRGMGTMYANLGVQYAQTSWDFDVQEIFRKALQGMSEGRLDVMRRDCVSIAAM